MSLLEIQNLSVRFGGTDAPPVVEGLDLTVDQGEIVAIVGESGSGKSVTMMAVMGLIDHPGRITADRLAFDGQDLLSLKGRRRRHLIGKELSMVFQDPMTALNPSYTVGFQLEEVIRQHLGLKGRAARQRALELLEKVEIPAAASRLGAYPHQLSGGMSQRVAIAMAIAAEPRLLIADEPTTALDVTIQAQIMELLVNLQRDEGMGLILITHDLAVVAETAQRVVVMYAGQAVEKGVVPTLFDAPAHPYTEALLAAIPEHSQTDRLHTLPGIVPGRYDRPAGCLLSPRCPYVQPRCQERPALEPYDRGAVRCFFPRNVAPGEAPAVLPEHQRPSQLPEDRHGAV
ncbi:dipeptide transport system ATP-binding protein [Pseudomonas sp. SORGH_AS199]|jgi:dipeptide transport system ATP-binding protein|uniref:ABC transporter ATP-binding protein n=1 Tax=Pseudomonas TaxID=286 RepID=UPI00105EAD40|nr:MULTISPECIES: ABC transporter ATP-binding protein [Pseudomonas]MBB2896978.1 dipeptide transport system ATP-binding protein [Pseudomonas sp. AS2.8]MDK8265173.1 ABC transporter ATP-binding protein [Pseudomonas oryzihabitans]MDR6229395.1 dipeptide transport system ATP-binding protein [Pseudomonas sp. SORGH_AS_0199]QNQ98593.1 dipeptide ABC transporter ATP-binding protein DppD [Pseudomonas psychrotolerans]